MSSLTEALNVALQRDLTDHLTPYQLEHCSAGKVLWPDATLDECRAHALLTSVFKKYNSEDRPSPSACKGALEKFLAANQRSGEWTLQFEDFQDEELFHAVRDEIYNFWYVEGLPLVSTYDEIFYRGGTGPGASLLANGTDLYTKVWDSPLSYSGDHLLFAWEKLTHRDPRWRSACEGNPHAHKTRAVVGNKLSFVNKNVTVARTISTEPTINMWFQLGLGRLLEDRLHQFFGINLSNQQEINGALARLGSEYGVYSTLDLASASDTISLHLCKALLPRDFYLFLERLRSPATQLPDGTIVELNMVGTMGNGFTFPLQTIIFAAVVVAVHKRLGLKTRRRGSAEMRSFGVFGDDIICRREATRLTTRVLHMLGFVVNGSKSYVDGPFRESCGFDYFLGQPVRGVYIKRLRTSQDLYVAINGLNRWSATSGIPLRNSVSLLLNGLTRFGRKINFVPPDENDDAGVQVPLDKALGVRHLQHGIREYTRDIVLPCRYTVKENAIVCDRGVKQRSWNPNGLWLSFLAGSIRGYQVALRQKATRYTTKRRVTSSWDALPPRFLDPSIGSGWSRWSGAVRDNVPSRMDEG